MMKTNLLAALSITASLAMQAGCSKTSTEPKPKPMETSIEPKPKPMETSIEPTTGLVWVKLPGGEFNYGCEPQDKECAGYEKPGKRVSVWPFSLMQTEVTIGAYEKCKSAGVCKNGTSGTDPFVELSHPVTKVGRRDATQFCQWVGGRLPTAEEWEYAAKSGGSRIYPWGDQAPDETRANCKDCGDRYWNESPVGSFPAGDTPWGLKDMAGNVWEFTSNNYSRGNYSTIELVGGGWDTPRRGLRASNRIGADDFSTAPDSGFRCAQ